MTDGTAGKVGWEKPLEDEEVPEGAEREDIPFILYDDDTTTSRRAKKITRASSKERSYVYP